MIRNSSRSRSTFDVAGKRARLEELRTLSLAPDFWNDQASAQKVMGELSRLSEDVTTYDRFAARAADARLLWELAEAEDDEATAAESLEEVGRLETEIHSLEVLALLGGEFDANPAILEVHAGEGGTDSQDW
ncbi:MAG: PCRF domain-containing protein, partial [Actinobacteria bacterium]|nr:PCRF domain-containing protein [Actinomycetota bacterium]